MGTSPTGTTPTDRRTDTINTYADDGRQGLAFVLTADELRALDVDPDDADRVEYAIAENGIQLRPAKEDGL